MIWLRMNDVRYENDIRALLMAFFPGEKIVLDNIRFQPDKTMDVVYEDDQARISWTDQDGTLDGETGGLDEDYRIATALGHADGYPSHQDPHGIL